MKPLYAKRYAGAYPPAIGASSTPSIAFLANRRMLRIVSAFIVLTLFTALVKAGLLFLKIKYSSNQIIPFYLADDNEGGLPPLKL